MTSPLSSRLIVLMIFGIAFLLRIWGISFGLPDLYHADEPIVVNHAVAYGTGDPNPHFFKIPPLVSYLLFACYGIYFLIANLLGWVDGLRGFQILFLTDPTSFYLIARFVFGALLGTFTVFLLYRLIAKHFSKNHAFLSAFFLATAFLHVRDSHYIYVDIPLLAVLVACFFFIFQILERGKRGDYLLFGVLAGTAMATKYNGVFIFVPFLVAHLKRNKFQFSKILGANLMRTSIVSLITFGLLNPFSWLDAPFFLKELLKQGASTGTVGFLHHLNYSLIGGLGISLCFFSLVGLFYSLVRPESKRMVLASFILVYYFLLTLFSQPYDRYVLPLIPFLVFFSADVLLIVSKRLGFKTLGVFTLALLVAIPSLAKVFLSNQLFSRKDTRTVSREWVESNLPAGTRIAIDIPFFVPRLRPTIAQLEEKMRIARESGSSAQVKRLELLLGEAQSKGEGGRYRLYFLREGDSTEEFLFARPTAPYLIGALRDRDISYVITTSTAQGQNVEFYQALREEADRIARFSPYKDPLLSMAIDKQPLTGGPFLWRELAARERNGQIIEVYEID